mgnify:CR=1 FL=1
MLELGQIFLNDSAEDGGSGVATPLTTHATYYQTEGGGQTSTLAAGTEGQVKVLAMETHGGGNMVVTVTNPASGYKTAPTIAISARTGTQATPTVTLTRGIVETWNSLYNYAAVVLRNGTFATSQLVGSPNGYATMSAFTDKIVDEAALNIGLLTPGEGTKS